MQKWEYLFVVCEYQNDDWRPKYMNGQELRDWKRGPSVSDFSNQIGADGWELVNLMTGVNQFGETKSYRLVFKRQRP